MIRQPEFRVPVRASACATALAILGAAAALIGLRVDPQHAWPQLLVNGFYITGAALGGLVFISFQYLSGASWCASLRRVPEAMMAALPASALVMLSLFFGRARLYPASTGADTTHASAAKLFYLSAPFFFSRMASFLGAWLTLAFLVRRTSVRQDFDPSPIHHQRLTRYSAVFVVVFAISFSLASFDWLMTLIPGWTSTIFGVYTIAGVIVQGIAAIIVGVVLLEERGDLRRIVTDDQLHDLGKLLFGFTTFWAYIWVSQYLLIWYANLPEEITYYVKRTGEGWIGLFILNVILNWVVPFIALMPRAAKRSRPVLKWVAIVVLCGRWLDVYLTVMPEMIAAPALQWTDLLMAAGHAAVFFLIAVNALASAPLVPVNDPQLRPTLAHHQ